MDIFNELFEDLIKLGYEEEEVILLLSTFIEEILDKKYLYKI